MHPRRLEQTLAWRRQRYQADKTGTTYAQASAYLTAMKATEELTWLNEMSSLCATATGTVVRVFRDRASGLREGRPGLEKLLAAAADGQVTVVRVTHGDRLARSGAGRLRRLLAVHGAAVEVLHPQAQGGREELLEEFVSLATAFAGRLYGMRSAAACKRLLAGSDRHPPGRAR
jgi:predicted site-specific integrase-resolvase